RIINVPKRGIGLTSIDKITNYAMDHNISFYEALKRSEYIPTLGRAASRVNSFVSFIEVIKSKLSNPDYSLIDLIDEILEGTKYEESLDDLDPIKVQDRLDNIGELKSKI